MTKAKSYKSAKDFRVALEHRLQKHAAVSGLDLRRLRRTVAFNRFLARIFADGISQWVLKGGYAMELRLHSARATLDVDLSFRGSPKSGIEAQTDYLQRLLADAAKADLGDFFEFEIGGVQMESDGPLYGGARYPVRSVIDGRLFVSFHVDVAVGDFIPVKLETAHEQGLLSFAGVKPSTFQMIPKEVQFAEKLHSYTMPRPVPNSRVRDLVDMILLIQEGRISSVKAREVLQSVFNRRKSHAVPVVLKPAPASWEKRFSEMATECGLKLDFNAGFEVLNRFYSNIV
ncbi:MAG: nucleotidyl transferase AbiEii/AbiGii toxin family protein [Elusimicrobia bacterium]|nr:nucleotidyl transferase AbiEii/AbiGii toxin family protein [Elusimicrobiota bacterium]